MAFIPQVAAYLFRVSRYENPERDVRSRPSKDRCQREREDIAGKPSFLRRSAVARPAEPVARQPHGKKRAGRYQEEEQSMPSIGTDGDTALGPQPIHTQKVAGIFSQLSIDTNQQISRNGIRPA